MRTNKYLYIYVILVFLKHCDIEAYNIQLDTSILRNQSIEGLLILYYNNMILICFF